jgi:hypothetical protein
MRLIAMTVARASPHAQGGEWVVAGRYFRPLGEQAPAAYTKGPPPLPGWRLELVRSTSACRTEHHGSMFCAVA